MTSIGWDGDRAKSPSNRRGSETPSDVPFSHLAKVAILLGGIIVSGALFSGLSFAVFSLFLH